MRSWTARDLRGQANGRFYVHCLIVAWYTSLATLRIDGSLTPLPPMWPVPKWRNVPPGPSGLKCPLLLLTITLIIVEDLLLRRASKATTSPEDSAKMLVMRPKYRRITTDKPDRPIPSESRITVNTLTPRTIAGCPFFHFRCDPRSLRANMYVTLNSCLSFPNSKVVLSAHKYEARY